MEQNEMFTEITVFNANKFDLYRAYIISFSMDPTNRDEIMHIFNAYVRNAMCCGMMDNSICMPKNRIRHRSGNYDEEWYYAEGILIGVSPKELLFLIPHFAEIKTKEHDGAWCNLPIMRIPIESCMDDETRGAPVRIHRMGFEHEGKWFALTQW